MNIFIYNVYVNVYVKYNKYSYENVKSKILSTNKGNQFTLRVI